jgi:hypothetical protein
MRKEVLVCDIFGMRKDVATYVVRLGLKSLDGGEPISMEKWELDLCPAALKRLEAFIKRGTRPAAKKEKTNADS